MQRLAPMTQAGQSPRAPARAAVGAAALGAAPWAARHVVVKLLKNDKLRKQYNRQAAEGDLR